MKRKKVCPECGASIIPISYGFPISEALEAADRGEILLGGCLIMENAPIAQCIGPDPHLIYAE